MSEPEQHTKVTLEDLLRLKRSERPSPEFWSNFERELRQKQLTALVQKRRWWHEVSLRFNRRVYVPAGAMAIVAFTVVAARYSVSTHVVQVPGNAVSVATVDPAIETLAPTELIDPAQGQQRRDEESMARVADQATGMAVASESAAMPSAKIFSRETETTTRSAIANFARLEQTESDLIDASIGSRLTAPARIQAVAAAESEVAALTPAATRYQAIARYADRSLSPAPSAPAVVRERLARRLGDDLGDNISRIGVVGSRVSLKF